MTRKTIATAFALTSGLFTLAQGGAANAAIQCDGNYQIVNGNPVGSPYCREMTLARVARSYGWRISDEAIRYSESTRSQVCRAIGYDNRVHEICSPYNYNGADGQMRF
jgi:hypothetical protein